MSVSLANVFQKYFVEWSGDELLLKIVQHNKWLRTLKHVIDRAGLILRGPLELRRFSEHLPAKYK